MFMKDCVHVCGFFPKYVDIPSTFGLMTTGLMLLNIIEGLVFLIGGCLMLTRFELGLVCVINCALTSELGLVVLISG